MTFQYFREGVWYVTFRNVTLRGTEELSGIRIVIFILTLILIWILFLLYSLLSFRISSSLLLFVQAIGDAPNLCVIRDVDPTDVYQGTGMLYIHILCVYVCSFLSNQYKFFLVFKPNSEIKQVIYCISCIVHHLY